jgi:hypothetical protein
MQSGRRVFLSMIVATVAGTRALFAGEQDGPPPIRIPDVSGVPRSEHGASIPRKEALKAQLKENQKKLRRDADHLLQMAKALKDEADKTEHTEVLSLSLVRKTDEIEKLARQIKGLVRGF